MWLENLTKDFGDFTSSLVEDTKNLASMISKIAVEMTGQKPILAGDEDSPLAQECPLDEADVVALQQNDAVYLGDPCRSDERAAFEEWARCSVYSSANTRLKDRPETCGGDSSREEALMACRQRLLDDNPLMMEKFAAFVWVHESSKPKDTARRGDGAGDDATKRPPSVSSPNPGRLTEDMFFDRYFFRLSQLRHRTAAASRGRLAGPQSSAERPAAVSVAEWEACVRKVDALESLVKLLQEEISSERRKLAAVLEAARGCGLSDQQLQRLQDAVGAAVAVVPTAAADGERATGGGENKKNSAGSASSFSGSAGCRAASRSDTVLVPSKSSSVDIDGWSEV